MDVAALENPAGEVRGVALSRPQQPDRRFFVVERPQEFERKLSRVEWLRRKG
jgi:hypothetical protein